MVNTDVIVNINGYAWKLVGDQTTAGETYDIRDVVKCGGRKPWIVSCYSEDYEKPKKKNNQNDFIDKKIRDNKKPTWL